MHISQTPGLMKSAAVMVVALLSSVGTYTQAQQAQEPAAQAAPIPPIMQASPLLNAIDVNHDGRIDAAELGGAPARLKTLDKNGDGKITRDEGALPAGYGRPAGPGPGAGRAGEPGRGAGPGRAGEPPARGGDAGRAAAAGGDERRFEVPIPGPTADELLSLLMSFDKNKDGQLRRQRSPNASRDCSSAAIPTRTACSTPRS